MTKSIFLTAAVAMAVGSDLPLTRATPTADCGAEFDQFVSAFSKQYGSEEELNHRRNAFCENLLHIERLRKKSPTAKFGPTIDSDLTQTEYASRRSIPSLAQGPWCGPGQETAPSTRLAEGLPTEPLPDAVDWRNHKPNPVTAVNDQGGCNGCYGFSAVETIESALALLTNKTAMPLSVQQVLSCNKNNTLGCESGFVECVYGFLEQDGGLEAASDFPFTCKGYPEHPNHVPKCEEKEKVAKVVGWNYVLPPCYDPNDTDCTKYNSSALLRAIATHGPISTCLDNMDWQHYTGGVLKQCSNTGPGHCVQIVGYNKTAEEPYLLIRNSFGTTFGEDGYIRVSLSDENECGVADVLTVPHVAIANDR